MKKTKLLDMGILGPALYQSVLKLKPTVLWRNPVMFTTALCALRNQE